MIASFVWKHTLTIRFCPQYSHETVENVSRIYVSEELRGRLTESGRREGRRERAAGGRHHGPRDR